MFIPMLLRRRFALLAVMLWLGVLLGGGAAQAKPASESAAAAQQAFEEGLALLKAGDYEKACPKLEQSQRIQAGMGTQFRLAECYEELGKLASAWRNYLEVAAAARAAGKTKREAYARKKADALQPRLSRIAVTVPREVAATAGLRLEHNGAPVAAAQWGGLAVDQGSHRLEASAPGKKPWSVELEIVSEGQVLTVRVPPLEEASDADASAASSGGTSAADADQGADDESSNGVAIAGIVTGATGFAALGVGVVLGLVADSRYDESAPLCDGDACQQEGYDIRSDARATGDAATGVFIAGAALLVGGTLMWLLAPSGDEEEAPTEQARLRLGVSPTQDGFWLGAGARW